MICPAQHGVDELPHRNTAVTHTLVATVQSWRVAGHVGGHPFRPRTRMLRYAHAAARCAWSCKFFTTPFSQYPRLFRPSRPVLATVLSE